MKKHSSNPKKTGNSAKANLSFFQESPERESFFKPEGSSKGFFNQGANFAPSQPTGNFAPIQMKKNKHLPEDLQINLESSFGQDFSDINIQKNSWEARNMGALAYTKGKQIHFAPGQFNPNSENGKNLIGHEFTHVVQQRSGLVQPTTYLGKGLAVNKNRGLEMEADQLGKKAARGESISRYQSSGLGMRNSLRTIQAKSSVMQFATTNFGEFKDESYTTIKNSTGKEIGVDMYIKFQPGNNVDAKLIGMIQSVRSVKKGGTAHYLNKTIKSRSIQSVDAESTSSPVLNTDEGVHIDQFSTNRNPLYAVDVVPNTDTELSQGSTPAPVTKMTKAELAASPVTGKNYKGWGEHGYRYIDGSGLHKKDAELHDAPKIPDRGTNAEQLFETTALAVKGTQEDTYYGSVEWGWRTDAKGNFSRIPFKAISQGAPTSTFFKAAQIWNTTKTAGGAATLDIPIIDVKLVMPGGADIFNDTGDLVSFIPVNTRVQVNDRSHEHVAPGDGSLQHTVLRGDTLWDLAEHYYGDGRRYREIFRANRDQIRDPDLIYPGQELTIPNAVSVDPLAGKVQISIVDGLFTGLGGWVNASCLADERN